MRASARVPAFLGTAGPPQCEHAGYRGEVTDDQNLLGDFLRARRELVSPQQIGIACAVVDDVRSFFGSIG